MKRFLVNLVLWIFAVQGFAFAVNATAAECEKVSEVCVDGPSTKMISGWPVTRDCWQYQDQYTCALRCGRYERM